jgi:hypothetical protein
MSRYVRYAVCSGYEGEAEPSHEQQRLQSPLKQVEAEAEVRRVAGAG